MLKCCQKAYNNGQPDATFWDEDYKEICCTNDDFGDANKQACTSCNPTSKYYDVTKCCQSNDIKDFSPTKCCELDDASLDKCCKEEYFDVLADTPSTASGILNRCCKQQLNNQDYFEQCCRHHTEIFNTGQDLDMLHKCLEDPCPCDDSSSSGIGSGVSIGGNAAAVAAEATIKVATLSRHTAKHQHGVEL